MSRHDFHSNSYQLLILAKPNNIHFVLISGFHSTGGGGGASNKYQNLRKRGGGGVGKYKV